MLTVLTFIYSHVAFRSYATYDSTSRDYLRDASANAAKIVNPSIKDYDVFQLLAERLSTFDFLFKREQMVLNLENNNN